MSKIHEIMIIYTVRVYHVMYRQDDLEDNRYSVLFFSIEKSNMIMYIIDIVSE